MHINITQLDITLHHIAIMSMVQSNVTFLFFFQFQLYTYVLTRRSERSFLYICYFVFNMPVIYSRCLLFLLFDLP